MVLGDFFLSRVIAERSRCAYALRVTVMHLLLHLTLRDDLALGSRLVADLDRAESMVSLH